MENKQELQMSPIGINLPENYDAKKLLQALKKNYERCEKRVVNNHDYKILFEYLDLFLEHEQERAFLMDRITDTILNCRSLGKTFSR